MKNLLALCVIFALAGCASLGTQTTLTPQGEQAILALIQLATGTTLGASNSVCSQLVVVQPTTLAPCAQPVSQSQADITNAFIACATQTALYVEFFKLQQRLCPTTIPGGKP